ncbi:MAG: FecR family protein [Candidatus Binatus sp.]|uniref:FecR family protein n=1 Tax=Candidatus Binatus sp. TaxID=2811406 RepID=UPI003BB14DC8
MQKQSRSTFVGLAALLALATALMVAEPAAYAQDTVGTITEVSGTANVLRGGSNLAAAKQMPIQLHDRITTQAGSSVMIGLIDNSSLHLGENGILTIDDSMLVNGVGAPRQVGLLGGELHAVINGAMRGSSTTFEVHTPNAVGAVRGTDFKISYEGPH